MGIGTQCKIYKGSKKCIFAMANLQNYKRVKIRMDDMISQQFFRLRNLCYVYNISTFEMTNFFANIIRNITNSLKFGVCWRY